MKLTGGNYGGYNFLNNHIELENNILTITLIGDEFYVLDDNQDKWFYLIEGDMATFSGVNKY